MLTIVFLDVTSPVKSPVAVVRLPTAPAHGDTVCLRSASGDSADFYGVIGTQYTFTRSQVIGEVQSEFRVTVMVKPLERPATALVGAEAAQAQ